MLYDIIVVLSLMVFIYIAGMTFCNPEKKEREERKN